MTKHRYKIHDKIYDLTDFVNIHPGGKEMFTHLKPDTNITAMLYSYHKNPALLLSILPKYEIQPTETIAIRYDMNYTYDKYCELKKLVYNEIHERKIPLYWSTGEIAYNLGALSLYLGTWIYCLTHSRDLSSWWFVLLAFMNTGTTNIIFHETSHYVGFKNQSINKLLTACAYPIMIDSNWKFIHNYSHHCFTNTIYDFDFSLPNQLIRHSSSQKLNWYNKYQNIYSLFIFQISFLHKGVIISIIRKTPNFLSLLVMIYFIGIYNSLIWYSMCGFIFAFIAQLSHIQPECIELNKEKKNDFLYNQVSSSMNYKTNAFTRLLCFNLDIQIEHHLFPNIPHSSLRQIQPIVREYCNKNNVPYIETDGLLTSIGSYVKHIYTMSK